jgi:GNAT superfamily N-acetyltransferase
MPFSPETNEACRSPEEIVETLYGRLAADGDLAGRVVAVAHPYPGGVVELAALGVRTEHQGRGLGRRVLAMLSRMCEEAGFDLRVIPKPLAGLPGCRASLTREQLVAWYLRAGFVPDELDALIRTPRRSE